VVDPAEHGAAVYAAAVRVALVANPDSGRRVAARDVADRLRGLGADVVLCERGWEGDERERAAASGAGRVIAAGGDGIIGPCAQLAGEMDVPLAVVAAGTANDFARHHGLPRELDAACRLAVEGTRTRSYEIAHIGERPFVNVASAGLAPVAARRAKPLKRALGPVAYAAGAAAAGFTVRPGAVAARVDGRTVLSGRAWQVIVACTGAFGAGSGVEDADAGDGLLDLVAIPGGSRRRLPRIAWAMRRGDIARRRGVVHVRGNAIELDVDRGAEFNVDGEVMRAEDGVARFAVAADAYDLVVG
jgi:diacylglycerol kinase (ATP)